MNEILDALEECEQNPNIYIVPPDVNELTDEDSADSEDEQTFLSHHLPPNLLRAEAELRDVRSETQELENEDDLPLSSFCKTKQVKHKFTWDRSAERNDLVSIFPEPNYSRYRDFSPIEFFELFFDDEVFDLITMQSNLYGASKNYNTLVTKEEIKCTFAILIISGYAGGSSKRDYWANGEDIRNEAIYKSMRRNRFEKIMQTLHFNDNTILISSDKFSKLRPLITLLQNRFMKNFVPTRNISHDEAMVEYFGKHSCKQAIRNKPIRFGYKIWCQNATNGYLITFEPYQGKNNLVCSTNDDRFGKCAGSVLNLLDKYKDDQRNYPYSIFIDNFFTTLPLIIELQTRGYNCIGTVKSNRIPGDCGLTDCKLFNKKQRGSFETTLGKTDDNQSLCIVRWKDNAIVTVASSLCDTKSNRNVRRWCKIERKKVSVPIPNLIHNYNCNMGGTDRMDQNVNKFRIGIRGKKWWWCLFTWLIDVSINNAWTLANSCGKDTPQKDFRRHIALHYVNKFGVAPKASGRRTNVPNDERYDRISHFIQGVQDNKRRRCAMADCHSVGRTECSKCKVGLCVKCFLPYHTET